jgi:tetratricopeptide (TPR) repeat protein
VSEDGNRPPRGPTGAELDQLRATVKTYRRSDEIPTPKHVVPVARLQPTQVSVEAAADVQRWVDAGRAALEGDPKAAHQLFERAHRRNTNDARAMSHYGLTLTLVEGDRQRGIRFCEEAVRRGPVTTEALTNLARALVQTRNKEQAIRALKKAQELRPDDPQVTTAFLDLGLRRRPPIPFLPRSFFLNKWLGKLTWKLRGRADRMAL